jgi:hypothetical protein
VARYSVNYHDAQNQDSGSRDLPGAESTYVELDGLLYQNRLYSMRVRAEDFSGNRGAESEEASCETTPPGSQAGPTVALQQPHTAGAEFTTSVGAISFIGSAQDADGNLSRVRVANSANSSERWDYSLSGASDSFYVTGISLQPGDNPIVVTALDDAGNQGTTGLLIRRIGAGQGEGAAIIVGGHSETFSLQSNIDNVTNRVYQIFRGAGYAKDAIYYLSPSPQDADGDGMSEVDAQTSQENLDHAIRTWAADRAGPGRPLTLYLMDHGLVERFCADGCESGPTSPDDLDAALSDLEAGAGVEEVNVIIEACHSGSFMDRRNGLGSISKAGRVVITSTDSQHNAYASAQGAYFSDAFLTCAATGGNLMVCFNQAKAAVTKTPGSQAPCLDDNGDSISNANDGSIAQSRFLARFYGATPPEVTGTEIVLDGTSGLLAAQVSSGSDTVAVVWADVFAPSFQEPGNTTLNLGVPSLRLDPVPDAPGLYRASYPNGFTEPGRYRVAFYARDRKGLVSAPRLETVGSGGTYLPVVVR